MEGPFDELNEAEGVSAIHVYEKSGSIGEVAVNVVFPPVPQKFGTEEDTEIAGGPTVICCVLTQPLASVPVTV
jgi:hypothetical protein